MFNSMGVQKVAICAGIISSVIFVGSLFRISCVVFTMPSLEARYPKISWKALIVGFPSAMIAFMTVVEAAVSFIIWQVMSAVSISLMFLFAMYAAS